MRAQGLGSAELLNSTPHNLNLSWLRSYDVY